MDLARRLAARGWLLADGGVATGLFAMGLPLADPPESWLDSRPDRVRALHSATAAAGCDIVATNSFGANRWRLARWGAEGRMAELNRTAAALARAAAPEALVAGSIGPTGLAADGAFDVAAVAAGFEAQGRALMAGGADLLWVETLGSAAEFAAAALGLGRTGAPWCATMSFEAGGLTRDGVSPAQFAALAEGAGPLAIGANCGDGPEATLAALDAFRAAGARLPLIAKANAGVPRIEAGRLVHDTGARDLARYAVAARDRGAAIIGGCCGVAADHLAAIRRALEAAPSAARRSSA